MRDRLPVIATLGILILALILPLNPHLLPTIPKAHSTTQNITLRGSAATGWNDSNPNPGPTIYVTEYDSVTVNLTATDSAPHQLYIDVDGRFDPCSSMDKCSAFFGPTPTPIVYPFKVDFPAGTYTYYCSVHPFMYGSFIVRGFKISTSPSSLTILRGTSSSSTITLSSVNGFSGTASLSTSVSPSGPSLLLSSSNPSLPSGGNAASTLNISVPKTTPPGTYNVQVNGTIGSVSHSTVLTLTVIEPGFSLSPNPSHIAIVQGASGTTNVTVTSLNTFNGTVALSAPAPPAGVSVSFKPSSLTLTSGQATNSILNMTVSNPVTSGDYTITVTGVGGGLSNSTVVKLTVGPYFTLSANPTSLTFSQASSGGSTVTLTSRNGFKGNVTLSAASSPSELGASLNATMVSLSQNQTAYASITISATQSTSAVNYTVTVMGSSGTRTNSTIIAVIVSGFAVHASPISVNVNQGKTGSIAISVVSLNGFSGKVNLTLTGSISALNGSLAPMSAVLTPTNNVTATLYYSAKTSTGLTPPGPYAFNVTGTIGLLSHSILVGVIVKPAPQPSPGSDNLLIESIIGAGIGVGLVALLVFYVLRRKARVKPSVNR